MSKKFSEESLRRALMQILETPLYIPEINGKFFSREQDDHDGDRTQTLRVHMLPDGDIVIHASPSLRFRTSIGGGSNPYTHNALRVLMLAMYLDAQLDERHRR